MSGPVPSVTVGLGRHVTMTLADRDHVPCASCSVISRRGGTRSGTGAATAASGRTGCCIGGSYLSVRRVVPTVAATMPRMSVAVRESCDRTTLNDHYCMMALGTAIRSDISDV